MLTLRSAALKEPAASARNFIFALAGLVALTFASFMPSNASAHDFDFDNHEEFLDDLIEMDAEDIADLRDDLIEACADIAEAIDEIEEAKAEIREAPMGGAIAKVAFRTASATVSSTTEMAFRKVRKELDQAETELGERRAELGEAEFAETSGAIAMVREELKEIELALDDLLTAMKDV